MTYAMSENMLNGGFKMQSAQNDKVDRNAEELMNDNHVSKMVESESLQGDDKRSNIIMDGEKQTVSQEARSRKRIIFGQIGE